MKPTEIVKSALRNPRSEEVAVDTYDATVLDGVVHINGVRVPSVVVRLSQDCVVRQALAALASEDIRPTQMEEINADGTKTTQISVSVAQVRDEPIVLEFPGAKKFNATSTREGTFYPAERVELRPNHLIEETGGRDPLLHGDMARYMLSFTDTRGNEHDLVHHFGDPAREDGYRQVVSARDLERTVEALRRYGVGLAAVRRLNLDDSLTMY